jgi:hypothetical protein
VVFPVPLAPKIIQAAAFLLILLNRNLLKLTSVFARRNLYFLNNCSIESTKIEKNVLFSERF